MALVVAIVMILALTAVFASAAAYTLPTEWNGKTVDWSYRKNSINIADTCMALHIEMIWACDTRMPDWAVEKAGWEGAPLPNDTWYGTNGLDGALASSQATTEQEIADMEARFGIDLTVVDNVLLLEDKFSVWDAADAVHAQIEALTDAEKAAAADEIAYFELLFAKTIEIVGNINGQFSEGVSADSPCNACLYLADMYRDCGEKIAAAASNPGTSDVAPAIAIFAGISVLAAAAVVLKKKVA